MRPTFRAFLVLAAGIPLTLFLIIFDDALWPIGIAYLGFALLVIGFDALRTSPFRRLSLTIETPDVLFVGETDSMAVTITGSSSHPPSAFEILFDIDVLLTSPPQQQGVLRSGETLRFELPLTPARRGVTELQRLWLRWSGPMSLAERRHVQSLNRSIPVIPNVRAVQRAAVTFAARDALFGVKMQRQQGDGTEFDALREYVPGLDHRSIDWKHSARHHKLVCKEFRTERNHQIILAFDTGHLMAGHLQGLPKLDHAINAGLLLGYTALRTGDRIGVFGFDSDVRTFAEPFSGVQRFPRLQRLTAEIDYRQDETNFTLGLMALLGRLKRRSLIVLLTDFVDTITAELMLENIQRLVSRHLVLFVTLRNPDLVEAVEAPPDTLRDANRTVIADSFLRERRIVLERLRRMGVHCIDAPSTEIGSDLLNRYMLIKQQELI